MKIIVGMSGGVDSSMAALLLKEKGYEVVGVTLKVLPTESVPLREDVCCDMKGVASAVGVARHISIEHLVIDIQQEFKRKVIDYFWNEYRNGRTPNPCVVCNATVKFISLLKYAEDKGAQYIATGHYTRLKATGRRILLMRGFSENKDQAYFLSRLPQAILRHVIFPLGELRKEDVRRLAAERGLNVHDRPESQEICFAPENDYRAFLREACGGRITPGDILDTEGTVIGRHSGIEFYTVGQRRGLHLDSNVRRYVIAIDPARRTITVGGIEDLVRHETRVSEINWIAFEKPAGVFRALVKIRYTHPGVMSTVSPRDDGSAVVRFDEPQKGVSPGQAAVFYDGDVVIGGGWID